MITVDTLRTEVDQSVVKYGLALFKNYGGTDNVPPVNGTSLDEFIKEYQLGAVTVGGFNIPNEREYKQARIWQVLIGGGNIGRLFPRHKLTGRNYFTTISGQEVDVLELTLEGMLTSSVYQALGETKIEHPQEVYNIAEVARLLGVPQPSLRAKVDKTSHKLAGQYQLNVDNQASAAVVDEILRDVNKFVLITEVIEHLNERYGIPVPTLNSKIMQLSKGNHSFIDPRTPYNEEEFVFSSVLGMYPAMDLRTLSTLVRIIEEDQRLHETHLKAKEAAEILGVEEKTILRYNREGILHARQPSLLAKGRNPGYFFDPKELKEKKAENDAAVSFSQIKNDLARAGVGIHEGTFYVFLREQGFIDGSVERQKAPLRKTWIPDIITRMRTLEMYSADYQQYCRLQGVNPEESFAEFREEYGAFIESRKIADGLGRKMLELVNERTLDELCSGETTLKDLHEQIIIGCKDLKESLCREYTPEKVAHVMGDNYLLVPLIGSIPESRMKHISYRHLIKRLREEKTVQKPFGFHEFIPLEDYLSLMEGIQEGTHSRQGTFGAHDFMRVTGITPKTVRRYVETVIIFPKTVLSVASNSFTYRYSREDMIAALTKRRLSTGLERRNEKARAERIDLQRLREVFKDQHPEIVVWNITLCSKVEPYNGASLWLNQLLGDRFEQLVVGKTGIRRDELSAHRERAVWEAVHAYDPYGKSSFPEHFETFVRGTVIPELRQGSRRFAEKSRVYSRAMQKEIALTDLLVDDGILPDEVVEMKQETALTNQALTTLDDLPKIQRMLLMQHLVEGRSLTELAEEFALTEEEAQQHFNMGLVAMQATNPFV